MLRGKTGERRVRVISFSKLLQQWLEVHPLRCENNYPIWISEATNFKNNALGLRGAQKIIEEALPKSGLSNKHARLYILRHSRATHLAKHLTEAQMCIFFGWVVGTQVVRRYVHLSGKDVDSTLLALAEGEQMKTTEYKLKSLKCKRCSSSTVPTVLLDSNPSKQMGVVILCNCDNLDANVENMGLALLHVPINFASIH
jgi:integrase/recombinase XerD